MSNRIIKLPSGTSWKQPNNSDLVGSVQASRNLNFDVEGYVTLAEKSVAIKSENGDTNFDMPAALGKYTGDSWYVASTDQPYTVDFTHGLTVAEDTSASNPSLSVFSDGIFWQGKWYATGSATFSNLLAGTWTTVTLSPTLTSSVPHPMCVFESRQTMCIGNGAGVKQIDTSHADTTSLVIPSDYEVSRLAYSGFRLGVATKSTSGVNKDAYFFVWDGVTTSANQGYPVGASQIIDVIAYQASSFVLLTSSGQLLRWNGAGFDVLANFPFYYSGQFMADDNNNYISRGRVLRTEGDVVYINFPSLYTADKERGERYIPNSPGGAWCYDPAIGLYHRYSHSLSLASSRTIATTDVNTTTDVITTTSVPVTGTPMKYGNGGGTTLAGLSERKTYYVIYVSSTTLKVASTRTLALAGTAIDLTGTGNAFQKITFYPETDFGQSVIGRTGGIDIAGKASKYLYGHMILSADVFASDVASENGTLSITVPGVENRGWLITPKITASLTEDMFQDLVLKYKPLVYDVDKIVVKYKVQDIANITQPRTDTTTYVATWTDADTFTTTDDLSAFAIGDEVEVLGGAGSGQTAHITAISSNAGTYTVDLDESLRGINASDKSFVALDRWIKLDTITSTDSEGYKKMNINLPKKWIQFKIELRGIDVCVEGIQLTSTPHRP